MESITKLNIVDEMLLKKMSGGGGKGELKRVRIGGWTAQRNSTNPVSINVSTIIPNYQDLTADNFTYEFTYCNGGARSQDRTGQQSCRPTKSYNPTTGVLSLNNLSNFYSSGSAGYGCETSGDVYCYYIE